MNAGPKRRLAAVCAAAALALIGTGCSSSGSLRAESPPATGTATATSGTASAHSQAPHAQAPHRQAPHSISSAAAGSPTPTTRDVHQTLRNVHVASMSFVGDEGWLLGTANCLDGSGAMCPAIEHSTDSGRTWSSMYIPAGLHVSLDAPCANGPCVDGIRYATPEVGYLFGGRQISAAGSQSLYMTVDGGKRWVRLSGGADALEAADGNVIRVVDQGGCPPGCGYSVQLAAVGSTDWRPVALPGPPGKGVGVALARSGRYAYLVSFGNPAGGASATPVLWSSSNDGVSWTNRGDPCAQLGGKEYDGGQLAAAPGGAAVLSCVPRFSQTASPYVTVSTPGGDHFRHGATNALGSAYVTAVGAASATVIFVSSDDFYRSDDGGSRFLRIGANAGASPGPSFWIGFSSATVGYTISQDQRSVWFTTDAGRTWSKAELN